MVSGSVKGHEVWMVSEMIISSLLTVVFMCLKVQGLVVELCSIGDRLVIWLVAYGISTGGNEIISSLLVLDPV